MPLNIVKIRSADTVMTVRVADIESTSVASGPVTPHLRSGRIMTLHLRSGRTITVNLDPAQAEAVSARIDDLMNGSRVARDIHYDPDQLAATGASGFKIYIVSFDPAKKLALLRWLEDHLSDAKAVDLLPELDSTVFGEEVLIHREPYDVDGMRAVIPALQDIGVCLRVELMP